ncbi:hypothetical protein [Streptomyces sp. ISL-100]|uniref:hypothetical protein n=1 Tax=Streptomyces sp. ISL-100 TaxID=2819173 RepID=UPI001BEC966A|nr:hypothetical protein [Streptomyces sp. ISL-100]MBT2397415.1 hypothetical protein [Streptomyces sp. ISL-100]
MDAEVARLVDSGVTTLGGLLATDAYERVVRPRLAGLLGRGRLSGQLPGIESFDRLRNDLADAVVNGDARAQRALARELGGYVRSMIDADPVAVAELLASVREEPEAEPEGGTATVSLVNNTITGPVLGSGVQYNSF